MTSKVAVIGSGAAGLSAAWMLARSCDVTVFEADHRIGGHVNTVDVDTRDGVIPVDTGFIVFNEPSYPNLTAWFRHLKVATSPSVMSFAISMDEGDYEYSGTGFDGIFAQRQNLASLGHWHMLADIVRFFRAVRRARYLPNETLGDFLQRGGYGRPFIDRHILPMAGAIWSGPRAQMSAFPMASFARFFDNHGLLQVKGRPQWRTVANGARSYAERVRDAIGIDRFQTGTPVQRIERNSNGVEVRTEDGSWTGDAVVLACHADQACALLDDPTDFERDLLGTFAYSRNEALLHTDASTMPRERRAWASWNYRAASGAQEVRTNVTYWMNELQSLQTSENLFVTLNPHRTIDEHHIRYRCDYAHPIFNAAAMSAQRKLWDLQGRNRTWFCGSYFGYGFHEDAVQSGFAVAEEISGMARPWRVSDESGRIHRKPPADQPIHIRDLGKAA